MRAVLVERRKDDAVVPVELDRTKIPGWEVIDVGIRRKQQTATQIANLLLAIYDQREQRRATRKGERTPEPGKRVAAPKRAKAAPKRHVLPTVVLMDSTLPAVVYDRETRKAGGTNADDITRIVSDLPITTLKETTSLMWQRDEQVLRLNPDVIVMHFSAFCDETSPDHGDHRLENFLTYMSASKANFLIYSRMTDAQRRWLDGWLNGVISRTPALRGRIEILRLRLFNQSHDVRERGTLAGARHRHAEGAGAAVGAGDDFALSSFGTGPDSPVISVPVEPASHQSPRKHTTSPYRATRD